ncbi:hypothetical protein N657DRAFT_711246 [Parathielavia appendiculata]|uniref:Uncharacterized protein n=1 Tax=Parathielavia appendiculata TaxID=2587402 RepID=A0AAN6YZZ9_9PEZI|nr:hypothetical protein N657DRAFT_711246 [Parathielavia appendiculata]
MSRLRIVDKALRLLILLTGCSPMAVFANRDRMDACGLSMQSSDFPDIDSFSSIEATFTIPDVAPGGKESEPEAPYVLAGVALCCDNDCSTRLFAGLWAYDGKGARQGYTAEPVFQLSPQFSWAPLSNAYHFGLNSSDIFRTRIEVLSPTRAQLTFAKFESSKSNLTVTVDVSIDEEKGWPILSTTSRGNGAEDRHKFDAKDNGSSRTPKLCGDSAWWFLSDNFDPGQNIERPGALRRFSPVLVGNHQLQTTDGKSFPADLGLSGQPRFWNMVRTSNGQNRTLCVARMLADSGMTLLHSPHDWGV